MQRNQGATVNESAVQLKLLLQPASEPAVEEREALLSLLAKPVQPSAGELMLMIERAVCSLRRAVGRVVARAAKVAARIEQMTKGRLQRRAPRQGTRRQP
ncbi:MAG: hypothetical protein LT106_03730 [Burkholderiaceae bacterium]|nr:hypothetical protein [Burkholderiaceae bacterium]